MSDCNPLVRNSAKAIIVRDGRVLLIRIGDPGDEWCVLPGGGQQHGESLRETVQRECLEEIGVPVQVGELRLLREFIGKNHDDDDGVHRVEFMFECQIDDNAVPSSGRRPDSQQTGFLWAPLADLASYRLYPTGLVQILRNGIAQVRCTYMGDVV
jgi:8-oxo-dGTP pyrophosphatase MutT (NUDIX family)